MSTLIVMTGLPGGGKSTVAERLARRFSIPVFAKDVVEAAVLRAGGDGPRLGYVGYEVLTALAGCRLRLGGSAILDSVATFQRVRDGWRDLAAAHNADLLLVECVCRDQRRHRQRIETRRRGIPGWPELTWRDVLDVAARYEPEEADLVVDTTDRPDLSELFARVAANL